MPSVVFESECSLEVRRWWRELPRAQRSELLRSRLRDDARDRATDLGRAWSRERLREIGSGRRSYREDPRRWGDRDRYEYLVDRVPWLRRPSRYEFGRMQSAPNLLENIPEI